MMILIGSSCNKQEEDMKRVLFVVIFLFTITMFAQEKKLTPEQEKLQKEFTELNQKLINLKAQVYDAEQFIVEAKKQMNEIVAKMNELNTQYQATLKKEKKNETP